MSLRKDLTGLITQTSTASTPSREGKGMATAQAEERAFGFVNRNRRRNVTRHMESR